MATPGEYLVYRTSEDCSALLNQLEAAKTTANRIAQRMISLGESVLTGFVWPNNYTQEKFVALYQAINSLPGSVVDNNTRDKIYELVAAIQ